MPRLRLVAWIAVVLAATSSAPARNEPEAPRVVTLRAPGGGLQPQAAADERGAIHLLCFRGDPGHGDLFYARKGPGDASFSAPVRVNSQPGSAIAMGTIRGGQIAVGRGGRVHVAWNGADGARPKNPLGGAPMLYARSNPDGTAFEPQRNLMTRTSVLDGGGSVAADDAGNVYVAWHGRSEDSAEGEAGRRFYVARSTDDGASFAAERPALDRETGACACCGTRILATRGGSVLALFRAASSDGSERPMFLLSSTDRGDHFRGGPIHPWPTMRCPMSSETIAEGRDSVLAAWETEGQVYFSAIDPRTGRPGRPVAPAGGRGQRKHPAVAVNRRGEVLLAWAEGTGWDKGGDLAWQVFDASGRPLGTPGRVAGGIPAWSLPTAVAGPDGGFTIVH